MKNLEKRTERSHNKVR